MNQPPTTRKYACTAQQARFYRDEDVKCKIAEIEEKKLSWRSTLFLAYSSIGVIYGDVGTSPLYVYASVFTDFIPDKEDILGAVSIIFWSMTLVALIKYVFIVLQAGDQGEGGTFALYTRLCRSLGINASGSAAKKKEHVELVQTAAALSTLSRASRRNSLNRRTTVSNVSHPAVFRELEGLQEDEEGRVENSLSAGNKASADVHPIMSLPSSSVSTRQPLSASRFMKRLNDLVHWMPFPAKAVMHIFQNSSTARLSFLSISVIATCMVISDGVLTPSISVVSAVSGLQQQVNINQGVIVGASCGILIALFVAQSMGTESVSMFLSPIMVVWFMSISGIGIYNMTLYGTNVWSGLNPYWIYVYFIKHGFEAWKSLGGTMLCMTGTEAMFANLGHFSVPSIGISFSLIVYPSVMLSYLGQATYLQAYPENVSSAFWSAVPSQFIWPMLIIATLAAVVASQAMITGCFSILRQSTTLGLFPKLKVVHTGEKVEGQIYIGVVNYTLMLLCVAAVAGFNGNSTALGNAYGIAVSSVFLITTNYITLCMIVDWKLNAALIVFFWCLYNLIEGAYLSANLLKVPQGGWFTLAITAGFALIKFGWLSGHNAKKEALKCAQQQVSLTDIMAFPDGGDAADLGNVTLHKTSSDQRGHASIGANISSSSAPLSEFAMKSLATTSVGSASGRASAAAMARQYQDLNTRSGHALAIKSSRKLGAELPTSTPTAIRRAQQKGFVVGHSTENTRYEDEAASEDLESAMFGSAAEMGPYMHTHDLAEHQTLLARLRGIGLYYTNSSHGIPPVMWAFLRNVEAVHEFAILIQNRFVPIPYLTEDERLAAVPVRGIPNFYRVVARYGYMDIVDHGPAFVQSVIDYVAGQLECVADPSKIIRIPQSEAALVSMALAGVPEDMPMMTVMNETSTHKVVETLGNTAMQPSLSVASVQGRKASVHMVLDSQDPLKRAAAAASLEVLRRAAEDGAVYYLGRTNYQMKAMPNGISKIVHDIWYGDFYRFMAVNCWAQTEAWNIPNKRLVELGITVEI